MVRTFNEYRGYPFGNIACENENAIYVSDANKVLNEDEAIYREAQESVVCPGSDEDYETLKVLNSHYPGLP